MCNKKYFQYNEKVHFFTGVIVLSTHNSDVPKVFRVARKDGLRRYSLYKWLKHPDIMALR